MYGRMARGGHGLPKRLKFHPGPPCPALLPPVGRWPVAVFYPFGHPTPCAFDRGGNQARMGRGIHGLPKVSCGSAMPDPLYALQAGHPPNGLTAIWGVAHPQGGRPAAVFFPLGYPFPYGPESTSQAD
jgi:hypothetical protein